MKINKLFLLPLIALSLISCQNNTSSSVSSQTSEKPTSSEIESTSEEISSSSTSEISQSSTSEEQIYDNRGWSQADADLQRQYLNGYVMPYIKLPNMYWEYFAPLKTITLVSEKCEDNNVIQSFKNILVEDGFTCNTNDYDDGNIWNEYGYKDLANTAKNEHLYFNSTRNMGTRVFRGVIGYHIDNNVYDEEFVNNAIKQVFDVNITIPKPNFEFYDIDYEASKSGGNVVVKLYGEDHVKDYQNQLKAINWYERIDSFSQKVYSDPDLLLDIVVTYEEDHTYISIMANHAEWTFNEQKLMKEHLNGYVLPYVPTNGGVWSYDSDYDQLHLIKPNGTIDDINNYANWMIKKYWNEITSSIIVDEGERVFYMSLENKELNEALVVDIFLDANLNFVVTGEYQIDVPTWNQDEVNKAIKDVFNLDIVFPQPSFTFQHFEVEAYKLDEEVYIRLFGENNAEIYKNQLISAGFKQSENPVGLYDLSNSIYVTVTYLDAYQENTIHVMKVSSN